MKECHGKVSYKNGYRRAIREVGLDMTAAAVRL